MTGSSKIGLGKAITSTHIVSKFQPCTSSGFGIISDLITFQVKNYRFSCFFGLNSRSRDLWSPKLAHKTLLLIIMLSPNFNFLGFTVCYLHANQSLSSKIREQNQWYYALTRSLNYASTYWRHRAVKFQVLRSRSFHRKATRIHVILK